MIRSVSFYRNAISCDYWENIVCPTRTFIFIFFGRVLSAFGKESSPSRCFGNKFSY